MINRKLIFLFSCIILTSCFKTKFDYSITKESKTNSIIFSEQNNRLFTENGFFELNMHYNINKETFEVDFIYNDMDWILIDSTKMLMFLFSDSNYYTIDTKYKIKYSKDNEIHEKKNFQVSGKFKISEILLEKIINQNIYGLRLNGTYKYIEYKNGIRKIQSRWRQTIQKIQEK